MTTTHPDDLNWLLDDLVDRLTGVQYAVVHSTDGLVLGRANSMTREDAEHFGAMSATLHGLARSAGSRFRGGAVRQAAIELEHAVLFVTAAGENACIALQATNTTDLGMVAYEMNVTVARVGAFLSTQPRGYRRDPPAH
ncbi:roadblock/LC7 domain-containing protein [Nocardia macrotermitis]|uniref:Serine protease inhibitor n=1 Tax=Nocardia macrotermitis TaxID=2585198 RepID=A0A7K0D6L2_9NOCA|nr:roadblock/LC7 domain-containing protein [Nocardia macrotermitis]MQY20962.1 Serine protease inhibitor [Nocardia macrotermitis]